MEVVAVSHSHPRWLNMSGRRVFTSIIHTPLTQPSDFITVDSKGIHENSSAAHNGQVYAFFAHHYDYWMGKLDIPRQNWGWCHWGENITFRCDQELSEKDFHLGDVWEVGKEVVLQICGSRVPCFKLAWRCGQKDSWLQHLASTGKCGVYLKVLRGGRIHPGDKASLLFKRSQRPVIDCATIAQVAFADAQSTLTTMNLLVDDPDLVDMNKIVFRRKLSMLKDQSLLGKNNWKGWRRVRVSSVVQESRGIKSFYLIPLLDDQEDLPLAAYLPGQFITVRLPNGLIRSWSISSYPEEQAREFPKTYRISVKKAGVASSWMNDCCQRGTILEIRSPAGSFCLDWSPQFPGRQIYASAGIGITPMLAMLRAHLQHEAMQRSPALWIHVSRHINCVPFQNELQDLLGSSAAIELGIRAMLFITNSEATQRQTGTDAVSTESAPVLPFELHTGRPTFEVLRSVFVDPYVMDPLGITPIEIEGKFSTVYLCGPTSFQNSMRNILDALDVPDSLILSEAFSDARESSPIPRIESSTVRFLASNRTVIWRRRKELQTMSNDQANESPLGPPEEGNILGPTLLELAEEVGLTPEYGCRTGLCGSCEFLLCKGKVTAGLQPRGLVRVCIARPSSELVDIKL
ncbi:hypothetical protein BGZ63DRAFT_399692 [Mariannaea sp. PMI_226]|nr:hypothetical protein BGZ63DRAFT_399692 [Mariannaea sp. PMI_226]